MRRLYTRIYLHFLGVLLVVGVATSAVFALGARGALLRDHTERLARHVASLAGERVGDPEGLARRVRQLHEDLGIDLVVHDLGGRTLASAGRPLPALAAGEAEGAREGRTVVRSRPLWYAVAPVRDPASGAVVATLRAAARPRGGVLARVSPALAVALVLLIVGVAVGPLARRISRPVERLTEAAGRLGGGELSHRVRIGPHGRRAGRWRRGGDELDQLGRAFNEMADRVERLVRGQKELLASVSHDLRSPLARVRVALELLPRGPGGEARLRAVERDLSELERLVDDVLTTSRLEATGLPVQLGALEARALLAEVAARAAADPLTADREVSASGGPPVSLVADGGLLRRALWNLVENAAKYGAPPVALAVVVDGADVVFSVTDQGEGIPAGERERVFAPFYRADRARTPGAGSGGPRGFGLGLTLARRVAEVHGGRVSIGPAWTADGREGGCRVSLVVPSGR